MSDLQIPGLEVWPTEPLGGLCDIVIGRTPSRSRPDFWDGEHPWLSIADMNQGRRIRTTKEKITSLGASESRSRLIPAGTVLLSFKLSIGKVAVADIDTYTNEAIAALPILDPKKLSRDFLFWTLRSIKLDEEVDTAAKGKTLNSKKLARLQIPLPPYDEQRRIAAVLDKADTLRRQRQESIQLTKKLPQSVFFDMFGDPKTNPKGLPTKSLGEVLKVTSGNSLPGKDMALGGMFPVYGGNGVSGYHDRFMFEEPRIVIGRVGAYCGSIHVSPPKSWVTDNALYVDRLFVDIDYIYLAHALRYAKLNQFAGRAAQPLVSGGRIYPVRILIPSPEDQKRFRLAVESHDSFAENLTVHFERCEALFSSIQQRAFRGELDLSRLLLEEDVKAIERAADKLHQLVHVTVPKALGSKHAIRAFVAPPEIELELKAQDATVEKGSLIPWSADYFKYRILAAQPSPFSFADLMQKAETIFEESPPYETIRDLIFDLLGQDGKPVILRQRFDLQANEATNEVIGRKEIVLEPVP